jgi:hypothetical protein
MKKIIRSIGSILFNVCYCTANVKGCCRTAQTTFKSELPWYQYTRKRLECSSWLCIRAQRHQQLATEVLDSVELVFSQEKYPAELTQGYLFQKWESAFLVGKKI